MHNRTHLNQAGVNELLYQALETEQGGVKVYTTALQCAVNKDLTKEWKEYLQQTENHVRILQKVFERLDLDPEAQTPGRAIVRHIGGALVEAMELALRNGDRDKAQVVAAECVVLAETKDHQNWELIGELILNKVEGAEELRQAHEEVEDEEDEHLYHTAGWTRELWLHSLGLPALLPPPEEEKDVKTAIAAARAKQGRKKMLRAAGTHQRAKTSGRSKTAGNGRSRTRRQRTSKKRLSTRPSASKGTRTKQSGSRAPRTRRSQNKRLGV